MPCVARELGGSQPEFENITIGLWGFLFELTFKVPILNYGHVFIEGFGDSSQSFLRDEMSLCRNVEDMDCYIDDREYSKELAANDLIHCLAEQHNVVVLDYNWYKVEKIRNVCLPLIENISKSRSMYQYSSGQLRMVLGGIKSAAEKMMVKASVCNKFSCDSELVRIFADSDLEVRRLAEKMIYLYRCSTYMDCLKKSNLVSDRSHLLYCLLCMYCLY